MENINIQEQEEGGLKHTNFNVASIKCPECKSKGCEFCQGTGIIKYLPSTDAKDYIEIARAKWRIKQRNQQLK